MRLLAFLPLTFIAGVEGFGWFVAYLVLIHVILEVRRVLKRRAQGLVPVRVAQRRHLSETDLEAVQI